MKKKFQLVFISISIVASVAYLAFNILNSDNLVSGIGPIISSALIALFAILFGLSSTFISNTKGKIFASVTALLLTAYSGFNLANDSGMLNLPEEETISNWVNIDITSAMTWASGNNIEIEQTYEYSDQVPAYHIITQNIIVGTMTKEVEKIEFIISLGPNYDKQVVVPNMLGWTIDDVLNYKDNNFLNNVFINYELSELEKDKVINQDKSGSLRRNDEINITMSLGTLESLEDVELIDFKDMSLFDSTLWLKRNGIFYTIDYQFSSDVERHKVISQGTSAGQIVKPQHILINLKVSKGKEITVPNILSMSVEEVTNWVIDNKLQINFSDDYDDAIELGRIISSNRSEGEKLEEGNIIEILTSKGQLRMEEFPSLGAFRTWASKYEIPYSEEYEFNNDIASGGVISYSKNKGEVIGNDESVYIVVSQGAPVSIPNFYGMSWSSVKSKCNEIGLNCSYAYGDYKTSISKDSVYYQNKNSGSKVIRGTSVRVTLSKGAPSSWTIILQESWYSYGNPTQTIANLKSQLSKYTDVTFNYVLVAANGKTSGLPHDDSPTKTGNTIRQGNTYEIWIVK